MASYGVFLMRFKTMENKDKVLKMPRPTFDHKPVFVKSWEPDMDLCKENIKTVPIWVQLWGLDIKYWGDRCLPKIVKKLGSMIKSDYATQ